MSYIRGRFHKKVGELVEEIALLNEDENKVYGHKSLEELGKDNSIDSEKLKEVVKGLNDKLESKKKRENQKDNGKQGEEAWRGSRKA